MRKSNATDKKVASTNKVVLAISTLFDRITFQQHLIISVFIRLAFIAYGTFHDHYAEVPFTDIDYRVVSDASRHIINNQSPYKRHTYRYTPILAYLLTGNIFIHETFGKILFSAIDILLGIVIRQIILDEHLHTFEENATSLLKRNKRLSESAAHFRLQLSPKHIKRASLSALCWLYNPMAIVISTRGNGDAITSLFILLTIFALQRSIRQPQRHSLSYVMLAGVFHALAIHFRLYPLAFSLAYYLYLGDDQNKSKQSEKTVFNVIFQFNRKQLLLVFSTLCTLLVLTISFYQKFGYEFLYESYIYHLVRKDTRHNFSLYFYMNLLNTKPILIEKVLTFLPQLLILLTINVHFGMQRKMIGFCIFLQAFVVVAFNPVVTSQYFIWYLAILPICLKNLKTMKLNRVLSYGGLWCSVQAIWLYSAYLLEFKGWNTFGFIWMQGSIFFAANIFIMKVLIDNFEVIANF